MILSFQWNTAVTTSTALPLVIQFGPFKCTASNVASNSDENAVFANLTICTNILLNNLSHFVRSFLT